MKTGSQPAATRRGPKPKLETRDNLIRVGVKMFHAAGYTATGIKDVVDAAEVPKGSFYNHFESKEVFGKEVVDYYFGSGLAGLRALLGNPSLPPLERLRTYFDERTRGFQAAGYVRGCLMGNLSLEVADQSVPIRDRLAVHFKTWSDLIETCIAEAQTTGAICNRMPAPLLAEFILNSWEGAMLRMRVEKSDAPLKAFTEVIFGSLLV
ncbi:TetR family transcriptional regulator C-terminal domain-containing protein [Hyphomicrobium sp. 802]|uniref:TetR family transcriptional regulator C-terminal domain-containing protein n=1 Tax=Hyphomicrobium sp. 802 TaxID=1112272 RepID=UPI00045E6844|nr:TetR family transcriptional regulator C-terminal domain-containing protein [Hyphomicrobium sp. 802]